MAVDAVLHWAEHNAGKGRSSMLDSASFLHKIACMHMSCVLVFALMYIAWKLVLLNSMRLVSEYTQTFSPLPEDALVVELW